MIQLEAKVEKSYIPSVDVTLQVRVEGVVYITDDNTLTRGGWFALGKKDTIKLPAGKQLYLFSDSNNVLAEMAV